MVYTIVCWRKLQYIVVAIRLLLIVGSIDRRGQVVEIRVVLWDRDVVLESGEVITTHY